MFGLQEWVQHLALIFLLFVMLALRDAPSPSAYTPAVVLGRLDEFSNESFPVGYIPTTPAIRDIMQRVSRSQITPGKINSKPSMVLLPDE